MKNALITLLFFFPAIFNVVAQTPYFINYDTEDGLPSSEVYDIHLLFFFTYCSFLKNQFYLVKSDLSSVQALSPKALMAHYSKNEKELDSLLVFKDRAIFFGPQAFLQHSLHPLPLQPLNKDWVGTGHHHVFRMDSEGVLKDSVNIGEAILNCYVDRANDLWVGTAAGLFFFKKGNLQNPAKRFFDDYSISSLTQDAEGNYWIHIAVNFIATICYCFGT
jgi:Predicted periplasmic ligand-binding sensor domain